jgi:hypothetical protein
MLARRLVSAAKRRFARSKGCDAEDGTTAL